MAEWKELLRARVLAARVARDNDALAALRETLAALDNAEAPPRAEAAATTDGPFAGSVQGLGAAEVDRLALSPEDVARIIAAEVRERRAAAQTYAALGRDAEARRLDTQADLIASL